MISEKINCKLSLIGNGPERPNAENLVKNLKISENVEFLGNVKNVQKILGKSDLFLLPSEDESFGLAAHLKFYRTQGCKRNSAITQGRKFLRSILQIKFCPNMKVCTMKP